MNLLQLWDTQVGGLDFLLREEHCLGKCIWESLLSWQCSVSHGSVPRVSRSGRAERVKSTGNAWSHLICVLPSLKYRLAFVLGFPVLQSTCIHIRFMYWAGVQEWDQSTGHPMAVHHFIPRTLGLPLPKVTRLVLCQGSHSNWQPSLPTGSMVPSWCPPICRAPSVLSVPETHSIPVPDPVRLGGLWESKRQRPWTSLAQNHLNHRNLGAKNNIGWECILL